MKYLSSTKTFLFNKREWRTSSSSYRLQPVATQMDKLNYDISQYNDTKMIFPKNEATSMLLGMPLNFFIPMRKYEKVS